MECRFCLDTSTYSFDNIHAASPFILSFFLFLSLLPFHVDYYSVSMKSSASSGVSDGEYSEVYCKNCADREANRVRTSGLKNLTSVVSYFDADTEVASVAVIFERTFIRDFKYRTAFLLREKKKKEKERKDNSTPFAKRRTNNCSFPNTFLYNANVQLRLIGSCATYRDR